MQIGPASCIRIDVIELERACCWATFARLLINEGALLSNSRVDLTLRLLRNADRPRLVHTDRCDRARARLLLGNVRPSSHQRRSTAVQLARRPHASSPA